MTCRCSHPFSLHMANVRGKPFIFNGRCCQWEGSYTNTGGFPLHRTRERCQCQEFVRG